MEKFGHIVYYGRYFYGIYLRNHLLKFSEGRRWVEIKKKVGRWKKDKKLTKSSENFRDGVARKVNMFIINEMSRNFKTLSSMLIKYVYI